MLALDRYLIDYACNRGALYDLSAHARGRSGGFPRPFWRIIVSFDDFDDGNLRFCLFFASTGVIEANNY